MIEVKILKGKIIMLMIMLLALIGVNEYAFHSPSAVNRIIATRVMAAPANSAFADANFYACIVDSYNKEHESNISYNEILSDEQLATIENIFCTSSFSAPVENKIKNIDGIEKLTNVISINFYSQNIEIADFSSNLKLQKIDLRDNKLTNINITKNLALQSLSLDEYKGSSIDLSQNRNIITLALNEANLNAIDLSSLSNLEYLYMNNGTLQSIDLSKNLKLKNVYLHNNNIMSIDVTKNVELQELNVGDNKLTNIDLTNNKELVKLYLYENELTELNALSQKIKVLSLSGNKLTQLDLKSMPELSQLAIGDGALRIWSYGNNGIGTGGGNTTSGNKISKLNLISNPELVELYGGNNLLTELNLSNNSKLKILKVGNNRLEKIDLVNNSNIESLSIDSNDLKEISLPNANLLTQIRQKYKVNFLQIGNGVMDINNNYNLYFKDKIVLNVETTSDNIDEKLGLINLTAKIYQNETEVDGILEDGATYDIKILNDANEVIYETKLEYYINANFNDQKFYACIVDSYNKSNNTEYIYSDILTFDQLELIESIKCMQYGIYDITGIEHLVGLKNIELLYENVYNADFSYNTELESISIVSSVLQTINVQNNYKLKGLNLYSNKMKTLNVNNNVMLEDLNVRFNDLYELDVTANTLLTKLSCSDNELETMDLSKNVLLENLDIGTNNLIDINLANNNLIKRLDVRSNEIKNIDLKHMSQLENVYLYYAPLEKTIGLYVGESRRDLNPVELPSHYGTTIISIDGTDKIVFDKDALMGKEVGKYSFVAQYILQSDSNHYKVNYTAYVIKAVSEKYIIDEKDGYIYTHTDVTENEILNNIDLNYGNAVIENNQLKIMLGNQLVKTFEIVNIETDYNLNNPYIYTEERSFDIDNINVINGIKEYKDNKLIISKGQDILKTFDIVSISSKYYNLSDDYIYLNSEEPDANKINITNGEVNLTEDYSFEIKYADVVLDRYKVVYLSSDLYELDKDYIYTKTSNFNINEINIINGQKEQVDNRLIISTEHDVLETYDIVSINSEEYNLDKEYVYLKNETPDINKINITNGVVSLTEDYYFEIKYADVVLDRYMVIMLTSDYYDLSNDYIILGNDQVIDYSKITETNVYVKAYDEYGYSIGYDNGISTEVVERIKFVWYRSDEYDLDKDTLKVNELLVNEFKDKIELYNSELKIYNKEGNEVTSFGEDYQAKIVYNDLVVKTFDLEYSVCGVTIDKEVVSLDLNIVNEIDLSYVTTPIFATNQNVTWESSNPTVASVDENGVVKALSKGQSTITITTAEGAYTDSVQINVTDMISSSKYNISIPNKYIYLGTETNEEIILNNIVISENLHINLDLYNNKLYILKESEVVDTFDLVRISSDNYNLMNDYIYVNILNDSEIMINVTNGNFVIENDRLIIKKNDIELQSFTLVRCNINDYIYTRDFGLDSINIINGSYVIENNQVIIKYNEVALDTVDIVDIASTKYNLNKNYIYVGLDEVNFDEITIHNSELKIKDNKLQLIRNSVVLEEWNIASISSEKYDLTKEYIFLPGVDIDLNKIDSINCVKEIINDQLVIKNNDGVLESFDIAAVVIFNPFEVKDEKTLIIGEPMSWAKFLESVSFINVSHKLYDEQGELITSESTIDNGCYIELLYDNNVIGRLDINAYFVNFDTMLPSENNDFVIGVGSTVQDVIDNIDTNGDVKIINNKGKELTQDEKIGTKSKLHILLGDEVIEYVFVVSGDLSGDGEVMINDVSKIYQALKGKITLDEYDSAAGNIAGNDTKIMINDVSKLYQFLKGKITDLGTPKVEAKPTCKYGSLEIDDNIEYPLTFIVGNVETGCALDKSLKDEDMIMQSGDNIINEDELRIKEQLESILELEFSSEYQMAIDSEYIDILNKEATGLVGYSVRIDVYIADSNYQGYINQISNLKISYYIDETKNRKYIVNEYNLEQ